MGALSHDFTTGSVEAPISFSGAYEVLYGTAGTQAPQLKDNGGSVNAAPNNTSAPAAVGITAATATFGQKQYAEITVGANWTNFNSIGGGVFLSSGNNGYYLSLDRPYVSNSANTIRKVVAGTVTTLPASLSGAVWAIGDKLGILGEEVAGTVTLTLYRNPTGYDGDGFPSDGSVASTTDTDLTSGSAGLVAFRGSGTNAYATDAYYAGTASTIETATTGNIPLVIQAGYTLVDLVDPVTTNASLLFGFTGDTPVTGDDLEYDVTSTLDSGVTLSVAATGVWTVTEAVEGDWVTDITVSRRVVQADGTIGTEAVVTLSAATGTTTFTSMVTPMVSNMISNMIN